MITFVDTEAPITAHQIEEIERFIMLNFPKPYKEHLLRFNGGRCLPNEFDFIENGKVTSSNIDWFLAIYDGEADNLLNYIRIYKVEDKRLPAHIIPIAHDPGGNLICISCGGYDEGSIYFWDHENEIDYTVLSDYDYLNLYLIASDFDKFINSLYGDAS